MLGISKNAICKYITHGKRKYSTKNYTRHTYNFLHLKKTTTTNKQTWKKNSKNIQKAKVTKTKHKNKKKNEALITDLQISKIPK